MAWEVPDDYAVGLVLLESASTYSEFIVALKSGDIYNFQAPTDVFRKDFNWTKISSTLSNPGVVSEVFDSN